MKNLTGKVAVVTGGNSGIGYSSAQKLKESGATVIITGRSAEKVEKAANELGVKGIVADVSNLKAIDELVAQIENEYKKVSILFVNAGVFQPAPIEQISEESFDEQMNINFKGAVFTIQKFLPILEEGASIINLSSLSAYTGMANTAIYAASKAALNSFTRTAATELAPRKIRVNVINPGPVKTPIFGKTGMSDEMINHMHNSLTERIPLGRLGDSYEVANLVKFLASEESAFITGGEYNIDGGMGILA